MRKLQDMLDSQLELQKTHFPALLKLPVEKQLLEQTRSIIHETIEVERELNYKYWKQPVVIDWVNVKEEIVDQFIFLMNELNAVKMSAEELFIRTEIKQDINRERQINKY